MDNNQTSDEVVREVADEYRKSLSIPENPSKERVMLYVAGEVGAGKSTVVKPLAKKLHFISIESDAVRHLLKDAGHSYDPLVEIIDMAVEPLLVEGYSLAFDGDCSRPEIVEHLAERNKKFGLKPIWIHVDPPEEYILNKLRNYKHTWLFKDADEAIANYYSKKQSRTIPNLPFVYTFDPSRDNLPQQIEEAADIIQKKIA